MADSRKYSSKLLGTRILIIGGTSGIGFAVAEACLESGAEVIVSSSQPTRIENAIQRLLTSYPSAKDRISGHPCNLATPDMEENIANLFHAVGGKLDHIVFTAGDQLNTRPLKEATMESIQKSGYVRFFAPLLVAKHAGSYLNPGPKSSITLTTGTVSERPIQNWGISGSFGAGLHGMMRGLALDLAPVRVNLISPGAVETELWDVAGSAYLEGMKKSIAQSTTTGKIAQPEDIAEAYLYVLKDTNVTGSLIGTNGGALLKGPLAL